LQHAIIFLIVYKSFSGSMPIRSGILHKLQAQTCVVHSCISKLLNTVASGVQTVSHRIIRIRTSSNLRRCNYSACKLALQALYMPRQIRPSVSPSVRHTPVLCQNEETQRYAVFTFGYTQCLVFWCQEWLMGDDPVQVKFECKEVDPLWKQSSCTHFAS